MDSGKTIAQFNDKELKEKIRSDVQHFKIVNEEDLQQSVYHHLRNFIDDHKLTSIKISG